MNTRPLARSLALAAAAVLATAASAALARVEPPTSVYQPASHYGATLKQASGLWRLHALDGQDLTVAVPTACASHQPLPTGLWLVTRAGDGGLLLRAPSATPLPEGHSGELAVRACDSDTGERGGDAMRLPATLIDWLARSTGAVYIDG